MAGCVQHWPLFSFVFLTVLSNGTSRSLPEYVFTTFASPALGVSVHLYQGATIVLPEKGVNVTVNTTWPYDAAVGITVSAAAPTHLILRIRMPSWTTASFVTVTVFSEGWKKRFTGKPGTYLEIEEHWVAGDTLVSFELPMALKVRRRAARRGVWLLPSLPVRNRQCHHPCFSPFHHRVTCTRA